MSHDTSGVKPRPTEVVAVETVRGLMAQVLDLLHRPSDPRSWEAIEALMDEAAHAAHVTQEVLRYRQERIPQATHVRIVVLPTEVQGPGLAAFLRGAAVRSIGGGQ